MKDNYILYFAYGSNMNSERMRERNINFTKREHAILHGWRLEFNKIANYNTEEGYANIVKEEGNFVEGILYVIEHSDIKKLDKYEGYPNHYERLEVTVNLANNDEVKAITYVANPNKLKEGLKPRKDYLNHLIKGCDLLSENYCNRLKHWETLD